MSDQNPSQNIVESACRAAMPPPDKTPDIIVGNRMVDTEIIDRTLRIMEDTTDESAMIPAGNCIRHMLGMPDRVG